MSPEGTSAKDLARIYRVERDAQGAWLNARHDGRGRDRVRPFHYGKVWSQGAIPLERVRALRWRWRVNQHPTVRDDPWLDIGAALYVVIREPSLFRDGKGFKLAWLAKPGPAGTSQLGLAQVALRSDSAVGEWRSEEVDLCAMYRKLFGPCEGEHLLYVGVTTDADGTSSVADGDYADFALLLR